MYPTLKEELQKEWDEAEQARYEGLITEQVRASLVGKQILQNDLLPLCFSSMSVYATCEMMKCRCRKYSGYKQ